MQKVHNLLKKCGGRLGTGGEQLVHINGEIADIFLKWPQPQSGVFNKIAFSQLKKTAKRLEQAYAPAHSLSCQ